jgi:hypothetical protein
MTDTLEPTVERLRRTFQAVANQVADAPPMFGTRSVAAPVDDTSADGTVVDLQRTRRDRTAPRRVVVAVALVAHVRVREGTEQLR